MAKNPTARSLIAKCRRLWDAYCRRDTKANLLKVKAHMDLMAQSDAKTVKAELAKVRRVFNAEWKAKGYKAVAKKRTSVRNAATRGEKAPAVRVTEYHGQVAYRVPEFEYQARPMSRHLRTADHILISPSDFETVALPSDSKGEPLSYLDVWGLKGRVDPDTAMEKMGYEVAGEKRKNPRKNPGCDEIWVVRTGAWDDYDQREEYFSTRAAAVDDVRFTSKHRPKRLYRLTPDGAGDWIEETISEDQWSKD